MKKLLKSIIKYIFISNYRQIKKKLYFSLKSADISAAMAHVNLYDVHPFNYANWHHGFCYFTAYLDGKKVFVKVDTQLKILKNEKVFYDYMEKEISKYLIPTYGFHEDHSLELMLFEFLEDAQELNDEILLNNLHYLNDIIIILKKIEEKKLIHRDIRLENFMITDNRIKIIDFTFANSLSKNSDFIDLDINNNKDYTILKALGEKLKPKKFEWNDFISLSNIIGNLLLSENINSKDKTTLENYLITLQEMSLNASYVRLKGKT